MNSQVWVNNRFDPTKSLSSPMIFGLKWTAATTIGYLVGVVLHIFAAVMFAEQFRALLTLAIGINYLLLSGIAIGILQGFVLRKSISMQWWLLASLVGWILAIILTKAATSLLIYPDVNIILFYLMEAAWIGLFVGFFQSLLIREIFARAYWWIIVNLLSWGTASAVLALNYLRNEMMANIIYSGGFSVLVLSWLPGFVVGVITAIGLIWIMIGPLQADRQRAA